MNTMKPLYAGVLSLLLWANGFAASPSQPQNLQQAWLGTESLLIWDETPAATSYNIYRADETNTTWTLVGSSSVSRFRDPTFQFLPSYYVITAVNADGESTPSELSTVSYVEGYTISVYEPYQWNGTLSATNAIVQWSTSDPNGGQGLIDWGLDATNFAWFDINTNYLAYQAFSLTNLSPKTFYFYRLTSITSNRAGVSYAGYFQTPDTNHPPFAEDWTYLWPFPTNGTSIWLRGYDSNEPQQSLTFRIVSQPTNGTVSEIQPSQWSFNEAYVIYTPNLHARGYDRFQFVVNNGTWDSAPATVTITNWYNTPPLVVLGDTLTTAEDTPIALPIPAFDAEGDPLTFYVPGVSAWHGTISGVAPNLIFTPETNYFGPASTWWSVSDGYEEVWGWFQIDITPVNDKPVLVTNDMPPIVTWEDWPVQFWLWICDVDWTGDYQLIQITPPAHGALGTNLWPVTYLPETNFFGVDSFTIAVRESDGTTSDPQTYYVTVMPLDDQPIGFDQNVTTLEDAPVVITPTGADIDSDPALFTFRVRSWPMHGWVEENGTNFIYHPAPDFNGTDEFQFDVIDDFGFQSWDHPGTLHITVTPVGEAPVAFFSWAYVHQDAFVNSFFRVSDVENDSLVCEVVTAPTNGTVTVTGTNFFYQPTPGFMGEDSFTYRAFDGLFYSSVADVIIWVTGTNIPPEAASQTISTLQNNPLPFWLTAWDNNSDDQLTVILVEAPQHGTVVFNGITGTYTPATDFYGTDYFTYQPFDGVTNGNITLVTINVTLPNRPPVANDSTASGAEDSLINVSLIANDPDGDSLTYQIVSPPANGVLSGSGATRSYQPNADFNGTDSFTFRVFDGQLYSANATVTITVTPVNDPPVASNRVLIAYEDYPVTFLLGTSDADSPGSSLVCSIITPPAHGTLSSGNRVRTYMPDTNYFGSDSFTFQVSDGMANSGIATVSITVLPLNDAPTANANSVTTAEDTPANITLTASDVDGDALSFSIITGPIHGTLSGTAPNLTYTPAANYFGGDSFVFAVSDGVTNSTATVSITVTPVNDLPVVDGLRRRILDGVVQLWWNSIPGAVSYNVYRADETNGVYALIASGLVETNYSDADPLFQHNYHYYITTSDGAAEGAPSNPVFARPDDTGIVNLNQPLWVIRALTAQVQFCYDLKTGAEGIWEYGTTTNYGVTLENTNLLGCQHFTLNNLTPQMVYYYRITATDSNGNAVIYANSLVTDGAPIADAQSVSTAEDNALNITASGHNANFDNFPLTYSLVSGATHGTVASTGPNTFRYLPSTNYNGADAFTFKVNNGEFDSAPATVSITVNPVNDAPVAANISRTVAEDATATIPASFTDVDGGPAMSAQIVSQPAHGSAGVSGTNLLYLPATNYFGTDSFTYRISDGFTVGNTATVSITITNVEDSPIALVQSVTTAEDVNKPIALTGIDPDGDTITFSIFASPSHGTLTGTPPNVTYRPATNYNGSDSFAFRTFDGKTFSAPATVSITVTPVNDPPIASNIVAMVIEDTTTAIPISVSDVDGGTVLTGPGIEIMSLPSHGDIIGFAGTNMLYSPATNYFGPDSFTYRVSDGYAFGNNATVSITVTPVNDAPVASPQSLTLTEDIAITFSVSGTDVDGDALSYQVVTSPTNGTLSIAGTNYTYRPATNFFGSDSFTFRAFDGTLWSAPATVSITVTAVDDAPIAFAQSITLAEDSSRAIVLTGFDGDGGTLTYSIVSSPSHGGLSGTPPNVTYQPNANYNGADSFTFRVTDGNSFSAPATVSITITAINDAPVVTNRTFTTSEDTVLNFTLNGSDVDGDGLTFRIISTPNHGTISGTGPTFTYTPAANYSGTDAFFYTANDGSADGNVASVIITIASVNDAPIANSQAVTLAEDSSTNVVLSASDVDGNALTFTVWTLPQHGTLTGAAPNLVYTPSANFNGNDGFTFIVSDGALLATGQVSIVVLPLNDAPIASNYSFTVNEDWILSTGVSATDIDGDPLTYRIVTPPAGTLTFSTNGNFTYRGATNFNGVDSFTFVSNDGAVDGNVATVTITVTPMNDTPSVTNQTVNTDEDTPVTITPLAGDVDGDALNFTMFTTPAHGSVAVTNGTFVYTPNNDFNGSDSFQYQAHDGNGGDNTATVTINVRAVNDAPVVANKSATTDEDTAVTITFSATDVDGDALTYRVVTAPAHGTLSGTGASRTYTPATNYNGSDSFTYTANDGTTDGNTATVTITILAVNDAPIANAQSVSLAEDSSLAITLTGSDVEGGALIYTIVSAPAHGALSGTAPNLTYRPATNYNGSDSFTFTVNDGSLSSAAATVSITVTPVNDAPVADAQSATVPYNTATAITLTGSDAEGSALIYTVVAGPTNGTLSGTAPNLTYTPNVGSAGADNFTFRVNDGTTNSPAAMVSITTQNPSGVPAAPSSLTVTMPAVNGALNLAWNDNSTNEDGFKIERSSNGNNGWAQIAAVGINVHSYTNSGLANKTTYYYRVRAYNRLGDSAYSNTASGKTR